MTEDKKLYRSKSDRIIAGVCGGLGDYLEIDPVFIRLAFVLLAVFGGVGIIIYIIMAIIVPEENEEAKEEKKVQSTSSKVEKDHDNKDESPSVKNDKGKAFIAFILIFLGLIFLFNNFLPQLFSFDKLWPLVLIVLGMIILVSKRQ